MQIQLNYGDVDSTDALSNHVTTHVEKELAHSQSRVTRVEVHLRDDKQKRQGPDDNRCTMEARIAGDQPLVVEARADDLYKAISDAAGKLGRAVKGRLERMDR
ncbi:HPF/RaiA family ribosome-associated protein [Mucisphaera sp.]|uniref:HPF/RaiA family ribosome-associated protein n=1 Tax=Mucisphaera sp. TaxID=2913024 RepID=UPI003D0A0C7A